MAGTPLGGQPWSALCYILLFMAGQGRSACRRESGFEISKLRLASAEMLAQSVPDDGHSSHSRRAGHQSFQLVRFGPQAAVRSTRLLATVSSGHRRGRRWYPHRKSNRAAMRYAPRCTFTPFLREQFCRREPELRYLETRLTSAGTRAARRPRGPVFEKSTSVGAEGGCFAAMEKTPCSFWERET